MSDQTISAEMAQRIEASKRAFPGAITAADSLGRVLTIEKLGPAAMLNVIEMADHIAAQHDMDKRKAKGLVEAVFAAMAEAAKNGDEVSIPGFGKFKVAAREARTGRNPATGATIQIAASKKLAFSPAKQLKDALNPAAPAPKAKKAPAKK